MNRDMLPNQPRRYQSAGSSAKFFNLLDEIAKQHEPTQTQLDALESSYKATGSYVMESEEFLALVAAVHAQGSRAHGTIIRPTVWQSEGFDIDVVIRLGRAAYTRYGDEDGPSRLINDLHRVLKRYADRHGLGIKKWERCITLEYAGGMTADITPIIDEPLMNCLYGDSHARIPDRTLRRFDPTNPRGMEKSFSDAARTRAVFTSMAMDSISLAEARADIAPLPEAEEVLGRLLSRLVQILKLHRNVAFGQPSANLNLAPKSVFVTTIAAAAYARRAPVAHDSPLDLLLDVVETMPLCFERQALAGGDEFWMLSNLTAPGDNLASGMNTRGHQEAFRQWHAKLVRDLERILECIDRRLGQDQLIKEIEAVFGPRAASAIREADAPRFVPGQKSRILVGTAAGTSIAMPSRAHTFFGA